MAHPGPTSTSVAGVDPRHLHSHLRQDQKDSSDGRRDGYQEQDYEILFESLEPPEDLNTPQTTQTTPKQEPGHYYDQAYGQPPQQASAGPGYAHSYAEPIEGKHGPAQAQAETAPEPMDDDEWMKAVMEVVSSAQSSFVTHVLLLLLSSLTVAYFLSLDDRWLAAYRLPVMQSYATSLFGAFFVYLFLEYVLDLTSRFLREASALGVQGFFIAPLLMVVNWVRFVLLVARYCFYLTALFYWITQAMRLAGVSASRPKEDGKNDGQKSALPFRDGVVDLVDMRRVRDFSPDVGTCGYSWSTEWGGEKQEMLVQKGTNADPRENAAGKLAWLAEKITPAPEYINEKVTPVLVEVSKWTLGLNTALSVAQFGSASVFGVLFNAVFAKFSFVSMFWGVFGTGLMAYFMTSDAVANATTAATHCALSKITSFFVFIFGLYPADFLFQRAVEAGTPSALYLARTTSATRKVSAVFHEGGDGAVCTRRAFSALVYRMAGKPERTEKDAHISAVVAAYKKHPQEMARMYIEETDEEKSDATRKLQMLRPGIELKFGTDARNTYDAARLGIQTKLSNLLTYENIGSSVSILDQFGFDSAALAPGLFENRTGAIEPEILQEMVGASYEVPVPTGGTVETGGNLEVRRNIESAKRLFSDFDCGGPEAASKDCCDVTKSLYGGQKVTIRLPGLDGSPAKDAKGAPIPPSITVSAVPLPS